MATLTQEPNKGLSPNNLMTYNTSTLLSMISNPLMAPNTSRISNLINKNKNYYAKLGNNINRDVIIPNNTIIHNLESQKAEIDKAITSIDTFDNINSNNTNNARNNITGGDDVLYNNIDSFSVFRDDYGRY